LDLKQIKLLIDLMKRSDLIEFEVEEEGFKIKIKRASGSLPSVNSGQASSPPFLVGSAAPIPSIVPTHTVPPVAASPTTNTEQSKSTSEESNFVYVKSPMVGTFYKSASPESPAFASLGDKVEEKSIVCIIEAMKIMNEIQAETKGTIVELLVENGQPVEYGQRLFKVKLA
jgi:acetyl-CoA carboxylase biotin carboxyl carrier protein